jgi:hypothetical protein
MVETRPDRDFRLLGYSVGLGILLNWRAGD